MKIILFTITLFYMSCALAAPKGFYLGIQGGEADSGYVAKDVGITVADERHEGVSGRPYIGYQFNRLLGAELGFLHFDDTKFLGINSIDSDGKVKQYNIDIMIKASIYFDNHKFIPLKNAYLIFVKFGGAKVYAKPDDTLRSFSTNDFSRSTVTHFRPVFAVGAAYHILQKLQLDFTWMRYLEHRTLPTADFVALGLVYFFGAPPKARFDDFKLVPKSD